MPETTQETAEQAVEAADQPRTFTQEDVDRIVANRLARAKHEPPADYAELREKARAYDEAQEAAKSELERATERADKAERALAALKADAARRDLVQQVATSAGVSADVLARMQGDTAEQVQANADLLKSATPNPYPVVADAGEHATLKLTKAEILGIKNERERLRAIQENIDLFK